MLIWSGFGFLAALIPIVVFAAITLLLGRSDTPGAAVMVTGHVVGALVSAALLWWLGRRLNSAPGRELIDPKTGERLIFRRRHSLFWVPMQWWAVPYLVVAAFFIASFFLQPQ